MEGAGGRRGEGGRTKGLLGRCGRSGLCRCGFDSDLLLVARQGRHGRNHESGTAHLCRGLLGISACKSLLCILHQILIPFLEPFGQGYTFPNAKCCKTVGAIRYQNLEPCASLTSTTNVNRKCISAVWPHLAFISVQALHLMFWTAVVYFSCTRGLRRHTSEGKNPAQSQQR